LKGEETTMQERYDREAESINARLPAGPRLVVIGSTSFWHGDSESICVQVGRLLATIPDLVLVTGGVEGVGETIGRGYHQSCREAGRAPRIYHVLPRGEETWDYGETLFAGDDMPQRREILGRLSRLNLAVEGGPGTAHEADVAGAGYRHHPGWSVGWSLRGPVFPSDLPFFRGLGGMGITRS
jgi:predicted Rossmann-fold nucleotide-binding protein